VDNNGSDVTFSGELGSTMDDCSVTVLKSSNFSTVPPFVSSTITETVLPDGDDKTLLSRGLRDGVTTADWRTGRGDADADKSVNSMVLLSANDTSACCTASELRSASTATSFILADFPIAKHDLSEFAVDVLRFRVFIIDPVVISSPKPSS